jgi:hypothetical protein
MMIYLCHLRELSYFSSASLLGLVHWMTARENSATMRLEWDTLS